MVAGLVPDAAVWIRAGHLADVVAVDDQDAVFAAEGQATVGRGGLAVDAGTLVIAGDLVPLLVQDRNAAPRFLVAACDDNRTVAAEHRHTVMGLRDGERGGHRIAAEQFGGFDDVDLSGAVAEQADA